MRKKRALLLPALLACTVLMAPIAARATSDFGLQLSSGGNSLTFCDNNPGSGACFSNPGSHGSDSNNVQGIIGFNGAIGNWTINTGNGFGPPVEVLPLLLDLSSFNATTSGGTGSNALTMLLSFTGLTNPLGTISFFNSLGGTNSSGGTTITSQAWISTANTLFCGAGCGTAATGLISQTGKFFSGQQSGFGATGGGPYAMTLEITIDSASSDQTSFDSELSIPEPATLSVLGTGLLALGTGLRKRLLRA